MRNKQTDSVLLTRAEFERLSKACVKADNNKTDIIDFIMRLPPMGNRDVYTLNRLNDDLNNSNEKIKV